MEDMRLCFLLLLAAWPLPAQVITAPGQKIIKRQLAAEYAQILTGFRNNDPSPWIEQLSPDFQLTLFNGQKQNREWVTDYVRNNAKTFKVLKLAMRIKDLEVREDSVTALVEQKSVRTFVDEKRQQRRLEVGALQRETWERRGDRWRLKAVQEWKVLYLRKK